MLPALIEQFEKQTHKKVEASYASSATLATQILNGGPFGLFLSADLSFPQKVVAAGLADSAEPVLMLAEHWCCGRETIPRFNRSASTRCAAHHCEPSRLQMLNMHPTGVRPRLRIEKLGLTDALKGKLVVAENIAQTAQYADSGNADAGLISLTSALTHA